MIDMKTLEEQDKEILDSVFENWKNLQCTNISNFNETIKNPYVVLYLQEFPDFLFGLPKDNLNYLFSEITTERVIPKETVTFRLIIEAMMQYIIETNLLDELKSFHEEYRAYSNNENMLFVITENACIVKRPTLNMLFQTIPNSIKQNLRYTFTYVVLH